MSRRSALWALVGSLLLAGLFGRAAFLNLTTGVVGGDIDGYENVWDNYWVKTALFDLHRSVFFTDYLYYPTGISLRFHTLNPFNGLITAPFNLTLGYIPTINLFFVASVALTTFCAFVLLRDLVGNPWAAFAGATIFTFANSHTALFFVSGQQEKISAEWFPLYLFFMFRAVLGAPVWSESRVEIVRREGGRWTVYGALALGTLVIMSLVDWQYLMHSVFVSLLFGGFVLLTRRSWDEKRRWLGRLAAIGGVYTLLVGPTLVLPMVREALANPWLNVSSDSGRRAMDLWTFIGPGLGNPGYVAIVLAVVGLVVVRRRGGWALEMGVFWGVMAVVFYVMSFGPELLLGEQTTGIPLPYALFQALPVFNIGRDPGRFDLVANMGASVLAGFGIAFLMRRVELWERSRGARQAAAVVVCLFVGITVAPAMLAAGEAVADPPEWSGFFEQLGADHETYALMTLPLFTEKGRGENHYMLYQLEHNKPILGGRWARDHKLTNPDNFVKTTGLFRLFWLTDGQPKVAAETYPAQDFIQGTDYSVMGVPVLNYYNVRYIVLWKAAILPADWPRFEGLVQKVLGGEAAPVWDDAILRAYRVPSAAATGETLLVDTGNGWYPSGVGENDVVYRWADSAGGQESQLFVMNLSAKTMAATLSFQAYTYKVERTLEVRVNGSGLASFQLMPEEGARPYSVGLELPPGNSVISFSTPEEPVPTDNEHDARLLSFGMYGVGVGSR